ncbi:MAG: hypothetical protein IPO44_13940, partial [Candidatus Microthrix sp.]
MTTATRFSTAWKKQLNDGTVSQPTQDHSVVVSGYPGASRRLKYLQDQLCEWLEGPDFKNEDPSIDFSLMLVRAMMAHLYLAWIHPMGFTQDQIKLITPNVASSYAKGSSKMVARDLNRLTEAGLIRKRRGLEPTYQACVDRMAAFMAPIAATAE